MIDSQIIELAEKCTMIVTNEGSTDSKGQPTPLIYADIESLRKFADEYLALSSSEPVAWVDSKYIEALKNNSVECFLYPYECEDVHKPLFLANPINQQLLTERNECVEEIKRLNKILLDISRTDDAYFMRGKAREALSTTNSIKRLLEEVK